ncbi:hypothetical protein TEA_018216 [Camellia sinensis var. sinensis]|uniref:Staygreen protein domain-containing protein n=1 Tax=Camellia sinensis var. sinensis TaxID=542762 RepID=A0A4S4E7G2_CAMSN|nr:hypothetical protein TEA_018216 [Camellia sinensis var. sinensis]
MMDRSTPSLSYQAWRRDPEGVPCPSDLRRNKPRRVDLYYSSWYIRAVESKRGELTACEVLLFHHEEMGIPWEIAKLGAQKIDPVLRAYQREREYGASLSRCAFMAQINTKVSEDFLRSLESRSGSSEVETPNSSEKPSRRNMPKFLFVLKAVMHGDSLLFTEHQELLDAFVRVHFHSSLKKYNRVECWARLRMLHSKQGDWLRIFSVSLLTVDSLIGLGANNLIPMEIALKTAKKIRARERFAAYIVIPIWPKGNPTGAATLRILFWQNKTVQMMYETIYKALVEVGLQNEYTPQDYLNLRSHLESTGVHCLLFVVCCLVLNYR